METELQRLLNSPKLRLYYREIGRILEEESRRRHRFYGEMREDRKMELILGEVVIQSPVKMVHEFVSSNLAALLRFHVMAHDLGHVGHERLLVSLTRNDYEPDVCFWKAETAAGFRPDQMHFPAPTFVAEVLSPSTAEIDRTVKSEDYAAHGVEEYWIIDPEKEEVEQYILGGEKFRLVLKSDSGEIRSRVVKGFRIPLRALFEREAHLRALASLRL